MKKTIILVLFVFIINAPFAFAEIDIPYSIKENIKEIAKVKYPRDYQMQLYHIKTLSQAYYKIHNIRPGDIGIDTYTYDQIKERAMNEYPDAYDMQYNRIVSEVASYKTIENINPVSAYGMSIRTFFEIKDQAAEKYPQSYYLQLNYIKHQISAYLKINR